MNMMKHEDFKMISLIWKGSSLGSVVQLNFHGHLLDGQLRSFEDAGHEGSTRRSSAGVGICLFPEVAMYGTSKKKNLGT